LNEYAVNMVRHFAAETYVGKTLLIVIQE